MSEKKFKEAKNLLDAVSSEHEETSTLNNNESLSNFEGEEESLDEASKTVIKNIHTFISQLDNPRIRTCSIFPYTLNEQSEIALLFRCIRIQSK